MSTRDTKLFAHLVAVSAAFLRTALILALQCFLGERRAAFLQNVYAADQRAKARRGPCSIEAGIVLSVHVPESHGRDYERQYFNEKTTCLLARKTWAKVAFQWDQWNARGGSEEQ